MMNRPPESNQNRDDLQAELVAYLDDELDDKRRHQIDDLLTHVPAVRDTVAGLGRTWDALDCLPRSEVDESFTKSTVEMIAVQAASDVEKQQEAAPARKRRGRITAAAAVAGALLMGFAAVAALGPRTNDQLLADLPVVEDLDVYARTPSIEFLQELADVELFSAVDKEEDPTGDAGATRVDEQTKRRARIEQMEPAEKSQLTRKWERFSNLEPTEQQRMRDLHAAIQRDARATVLRQVMFDYSRWLGELNSTDRSALASLDTADRVARIRVLRGEDAKRFEPNDLARFPEWLKQFAVTNRIALLNTIKGEHRRRFDGDDANSRRWLAWHAGSRLMQHKQYTLIDQSDVVRLKQMLSADGKKKLEDAAGLEKQREMIVAGLKTAFRERHKNRDQVSQQELTNYFEALDLWEKDELLRLPSDEMLDRLRGMFFDSRRDKEQGYRINGIRASRRSPSVRPGERRPSLDHKPPHPSRGPDD